MKGIAHIQSSIAVECPQANQNQPRKRQYVTKKYKELTEELKKSRDQVDYYRNKVEAMKTDEQSFIARFQQVEQERNFFAINAVAYAQQNTELIQKVQKQENDKKLAAEFVEKFMQVIYQCTFCNAKFDDGMRAPKLLACTHTACLKCVMEFGDSIEAGVLNVVCPIDHSKTVAPNGDVHQIQTGAHKLCDN